MKKANADRRKGVGDVRGARRGPQRPASDLTFMKRVGGG